MSKIVVANSYGPIPLDELQNDVKAAMDKGYGGRFAFTPETVQSLIDKIVEMEAEMKILKEVVRRGLS